MQRESTLERPSIGYRCRRIGMPNPYDGLKGSPAICTFWRIGSTRVALRRWQWNQLECYWIPLFEILEERGFEVHLVNAKHLQNVAGRKSDWSDCQWIRIVHTYGLLSASFRPPARIAALRSYLRHRKMLVEYAAGHVQHMQKALQQMNLHLHHVLSDITGVTGSRIIQAVLKGERDPQRLAQLRDARVKSSAETIAKALQGNYRAEHVFALKQAFDLYQFYRQQIQDCDQQIQLHLQSLESKVDPTVSPLPASRRQNRSQQKAE